MGASARRKPRDRGKLDTAAFLKPGCAAADWIEARGNYVCLHVGPQQHLMRSGLSELERELDAAQFARIHRSAMVRIDRIKELRILGDSEFKVVLETGRVSCR
jgi:DNA-binding LytR/AlgR family response regulator